MVTKATTRLAAVKQAVAKKAASKSTKKKAVTKKSAAAKAPARQSAAAKAPARPAKKTTAKKTAVTKAPAKKPAAAKAPARPAKKTTAKKTAVTKAPAKKSAAAKAPARPAKKTTAKKTAATKAPAKKSTVAKTPVKKSAAKAPAKKPTVAKTPAKKPAAKAPARQAKKGKSFKEAVIKPIEALQIVEIQKPKKRIIDLSEVQIPTESALTKMSEDDYMNNEQLAFFEERLKAMRAENVTELEDLRRELAEHENNTDPADIATAQEIQQFQIHTVQRLSNLIRKVDAAIDRIYAGEYGYCEETGEPIGIPRLLARPTATMSIHAKEIQEYHERTEGENH